MKIQITTVALLLLCMGSASGADITSLCADRSAIERVYHERRTGTKPPFEQAMPAALLENIVRTQLRKERALASAYGVEITPALLAAEVRRIDTTTRAPEMLAEIKAALASDDDRFAVAFAKPFLVERELRQRFENDDALHAPQRRLAEAARDRLLAVKEPGFEARLATLKEGAGDLRAEVTWTLTPRPLDDDTASAPAIAPQPTEARARSTAYTNQATAQVAQVLSSPATGRAEANPVFYFEDLPGELQNVLRAQLRQPGDVSAVIESPEAFQIFLARECTASALSAAILTISKRGYDEWLAQQSFP